MSLFTLLRPLLFSQDPETVHKRTIRLGGFLEKLGPLNRVWSWMFQYSSSVLEQKLFGLTFKNPVGLAAGYDKNAESVDFMGLLGFGHLELGAVTFRPQEGNPKPRVFRLVEDKGVINRMGFNGVGAEQFTKNLAVYKQNSCILLVNFGKNKDTPNDQAINDYRGILERILPYAEGFVINVSSPNTPNLRALQDKDDLEVIISQLLVCKQEAGFTEKPLLLKIAPDLSNEALDDICAVVQKHKLDGIIATNTTIQRPESLQSSKASEVGGLSGLPLKDRATEVIRYIYKKTSGTVPIIGVGGIFTVEDAYEKILAGASLIQVYTGMIYEGPMIVKNINKGLVHLLQRDGYTSITQAVGKGNS